MRLRLAEPPRRVDRSAEVEPLVLGLLDQHDRFEGLDVVDALLLALGRNLGLVRPVIELHLRDARDLAHLPEVELDLAEMLSEVDRLEKIDLPWDCHFARLFVPWTLTPRFKDIQGESARGKMLL